MTSFHKSQAEIRYSIDYYMCQITGQRATQLAHRIANSKRNLRKYGGPVVNHNFNLVSVKDLETNKKVDLGFNNEMAKNKLVTLINMRRDDMLSTVEINKLLGIEW